MEGIKAEGWRRAEGKVSKFLGTDVREKGGVHLGEGSDTLQGRMDDNSKQLSAKFRAAGPFQWL